jgi:hypothetical protein
MSGVAQHLGVDIKCPFHQGQKLSISVGMKETDLLQFKLLLPAPLKTRAEEQALLNRRSLSQEIVTALEEKYPAPKPDKVTDPAAKILYWLAARIRRRNPRTGSSSERQAALYECIASDIEARMDTIAGTSSIEK